MASCVYSLWMVTLRRKKENLSAFSSSNKQWWSGESRVLPCGIVSKQVLPRPWPESTSSLSLAQRRVLSDRYPPCRLCCVSWWPWGCRGRGERLWCTRTGVSKLWLRPNPAHTYSCTACELQRVFTFLNGWGEIKRRAVIFLHKWKLYKIVISVPINKVALEHSHTHSYTYTACVYTCCNYRVVTQSARPIEHKILLAGPVQKHPCAKTSM